ncbi:MAG: hypothetical protein IIA08_04555 [Proteobacteria bacterium]|nr:hypothetical protein [Pseudomonadota bacterium]
MGLFAELQRRNVFRAALAYLIAAWVVLQISQLVLEAIEAPSWVIKVFLLVFALGLPLTLLFSWAYEITPEGIKREKDVDRSQSVTRETGKKLDQVTIALVVALLLFVAADRMFFDSAVQTTPETSPVSTVDAGKSIAVLAFEDLSPEGDQEYFADGLSEELLNVLAQIPGLQVAGRTSSFAFKGQNRDLREIGEILNVTHILEGSVRKAGNRIRVTAQLINATTGFHMYSESYDRELTDVFAVQDEIAAAISGALRTELAATKSQETSETSIEAYDLYLVARQKIYSRDKEEMLEASRLLDKALDIDSEYAPALVQKALVTSLLSDGIGSYGDIPEAEAIAIARPMIDKAIALDENLAEAHAVSGLLMGREENATPEQAIAAFEHALTLNPNLDNARTWLASEYYVVGRSSEARKHYEAVVERDPLFGPAFNNLNQEYIRTSDYDLANSLIGRVERIVGETMAVHEAWGMIAVAQGESARAIRHLRRVYEDNPSATVNLLWYSLALYQIGEFETIAAVSIPILKVAALDILGRHDEARALLDPMSPVIDFDFILTIAAYYYVNAREYEEAVDYVERHFDNLDALLEHFARPDGSQISFMATLAFAYLQTGREREFEQLTATMAESVRQQRAAGTNDNALRFSEAELAALTGTDEEVLKYVRRIVDNNGISVQYFASPIFERMNGNSEFQELDAMLKKRADDERAKLGLEPYQAIAETT